MTLREDRMQVDKGKPMVFHEIYGSYYNVVAAVLEEAVRGSIDKKTINRIVTEKGFQESGIVIPEALFDGTWPFLRKDGTTPLRYRPEMPLTDLQKAWINAVVKDPRVQLFLPETAEFLPFPEVPPIFDQDFFVYYDRYADGDPFTDPLYIENFRLALLALREKRFLQVWFMGKAGERKLKTVPDRLEYSPKDDKFRLLVHTEKGKSYIINMARVRRIQLGETVPEEYAAAPEPEKSTLVMELVDERNALERAMIHFSDLEKETEKLAEDRFRIVLHYREEDETEILIRVLSFGPSLQVISPGRFIDLIRERLKKQAELD